MRTIPSAYKKAIPLILTMARMAVVPFLLILLWQETTQKRYLAAFLFVLASLTDYWDGALARKWQVTSDMGKLFDPVADKVLVTSLLVFFLSFQKIDPVLVIVILSRDHIIGGVRAFAASQNFIIDAKATGKWKTAFQMIGIPTMMAVTRENFTWPMIFDQISFANRTVTLNLSPYFLMAEVGYFLLWISASLSLISGWEYFSLFLKSKKSDLAKIS